MLDVIIDALIDSLKIFPFILLIYIIMEGIEHAKNKRAIERALSGACAPIAAGVLGVVPECGFAVMCAKLYDKGLIKVGTLIAAFLAISDEGLIILLSEGADVTSVIMLLAVKIVYAVAIGEAVNLLFAKKDDAHRCPEKDDCIECGKHNEKPLDIFFLHPLTHAVKIFLYVLAVNVAFGVLLFFIGEDNVTAFLNKSFYVQPLITSLIGLVPNCGSSIILSEAYIKGAVTFSGLLAGLTANSGVGMLILLRNGKNFKKAVFIALSVYLLAVALGYISFLFA